MERYATSPDYRAGMAARAVERSRRFDWRSAAEQTLEVYERAADGRRPTASVAHRTRPAPKVLFVRLDSLGDLVLTTPCFEAVKRAFPMRPSTQSRGRNGGAAARRPRVAGCSRSTRRGTAAGAGKRCRIVAHARRLREQYDCVITPAAT
jgi:hypothetical protein